MLLADEKGASLIVAVGTHATLVEFLDKGRGGMASTFLTRLRLGGKLVDAKGVSRLYRSRISAAALAAARARRVHRDRRGAGRLRGRTHLSRPARGQVGSLLLLDARTVFVISFRYHVVSIVAVFLALALGVVVGTTALNGPITTNLRQQVDSLKKDRSSLASQQQDPAAAGGRLGLVRVDVRPAHRGQHAQGQERRDHRHARSVVVDEGRDQQADRPGRWHGRRSHPAAERLRRPQAGHGRHEPRASRCIPIGLTLPSTSDSGALGGALFGYVLLNTNAQQTDRDSRDRGLHQGAVDHRREFGQRRPGRSGRGRDDRVAGHRGAERESRVVDGHPAPASRWQHGRGRRQRQLDARRSRRARSRQQRGQGHASRPSTMPTRRSGQVTTTLALAEALTDKSGAYGNAAGASSLFPSLPK